MPDRDGGGPSEIEEGSKRLLDGVSNAGTPITISALSNPRGVSLLRLQSSEDRAEEVTVFIVVQNKNGDNVFLNTSFPYVTGRIRWGNGGFQSEAEFDVGLGTAVCVQAGFIEVSAKFDPRNSGISFAGQSLEVGAFVSYGRHSGRPPVRTLYANPDVPPGGSSAIMLLPAFARTVDIYGEDPTVGYRALILDQSNKTVGANATQGQTLKLSGDARKIQLQNPGLAAAAMQAVCELEL